MLFVVNFKGTIFNPKTYLLVVIFNIDYFEWKPVQTLIENSKKFFYLVEIKTWVLINKQKYELFQKAEIL